MNQKFLENKAVKEASEWLMALGVAIIVYLLLRGFVFQTATISGISMSPTFEHGDKVLVNKLAYRFGEPKTGDVIAFPYHENETEVYVKRIVGMPGDTIDLQGLAIFLNGEPLSDEFSAEPVSAQGNIDYPVTVPDGTYFVLGDNRNASKDSRYSSVGFVAQDEIIGKAMFRIWPLGQSS